MSELSGRIPDGGARLMVFVAEKFVFFAGAAITGGTVEAI
jgi:hypothetical protein